MFEHFYSRRKTMQGAALPIALIFLFIITLTGISMLDTSIDNQKLTNNYQHRALSYQAADSVLFALINATPDEVSPNYTQNFLSNFAGDFTNVSEQPDMNVALDLELVSEEKNVKLVGFELGGSVFIYDATSTGSVGNASVTNRMGVSLFRPATE